MDTIGIISEYNPFHLGHRKQFQLIRQARGADCAIVCLMSGNFVQRGAPALIDKSRRARAAILCGADLVLELPVTAALSSAEGFAADGVRILAPFCTELCFGAETADADALTAIARALNSETFSEFLRSELERGVSFPAARQAALERLGLPAQLLTLPNNILAVEYCKAMLAQNTAMKPLPIVRQGDYHSTDADCQNPSATAVRGMMCRGENWEPYVPAEVRHVFQNAPLHTLAAGERAILARLRTMTDREFEVLPYGSEGLWRKLMHAVRQENTLEDILTATKSKRYTRSRLDRMVMCAFLGLTAAELDTPAPYTRVLAFNDRGREVLKQARKTGHFPNIGEKVDDPWQEIENRCGSLYGLFAASAPEAPNAEGKYRIYYHKSKESAP